MGLRPKTKRGWAYDLTQSKERTKAQMEYAMGLRPKMEQGHKQANKHMKNHMRNQTCKQTHRIPNTKTDMTTSKETTNTQKTLGLKENKDDTKGTKL